MRMLGKILDNYVLIKELGSGGMGTVYLGKSNNSKDSEPNYVAIKVLHPHFVKLRIVRERFVQEAKAQSILLHENITRVIKFKEEDDNLYLVLEYLEGNSLEEYITNIKGLIPEEEAKNILLKILSAIKFAHEKGIVHRDLKPSNIMLTNSGEIKVMDFGIAKFIDQEIDYTKPGTKLGSPSYMSPEQVKGQKVDYRSDIYTLGVLYHQML